MDEVNMEESRKSINTDETLVEVFMTGGPPWGFNISGGSEFGSELFVRKVCCYFDSSKINFSPRCRSLPLFLHRVVATCLMAPRGCYVMLLIL